MWCAWPGIVRRRTPDASGSARRCDGFLTVLLNNCGLPCPRANVLDALLVLQGREERTDFALCGPVLGAVHEAGEYTDRRTGRDAKRVDNCRRTALVDAHAPPDRSLHTLSLHEKVREDGARVVAVDVRERPVHLKTKRCPVTRGIDATPRGARWFHLA